MNDSLQKHLGGLIGAIVAVVIGILLLSIGFLKTVFLALLACIGYIIGSKRTRATLRDALKRIFGNNED